MEEQLKNSKKILLLMMCLLCVCMLTACTVKHRRQRNSVSATGSPVNTKTLTGVVTGQDVEKQNITVRELDSNLESVLRLYRSGNQQIWRDDHGRANNNGRDFGVGISYFRYTAGVGGGTGGCMGV